MKLLLSLIVIACLFPVVSNADEALPRGHYTITGVDVQPINRTKVGGKVNDAVSDKLTYWVRFDVKTEYKIEPGTKQLPFKIMNPAVAASSSLTLDKAIEFNGQKVPAGTNLLKYKKFDGSRFNVHMPELFPFAIHSATLHSGFTLPADKYKFKFEWATEEGETFSKTVEVYVDVDLPPSR